MYARRVYINVYLLNTQEATSGQMQYINDELHALNCEPEIIIFEHDTVNQGVGGQDKYITVHLGRN
jgi:hypothetical protein